MTHPTGGDGDPRPQCTVVDVGLVDDPTIPDPAERTQRNAALHADNIESGFWDEHGRPAPWPDDIDQWQPATGDPATHQPGEQTF